MTNNQWRILIIRAPDTQEARRVNQASIADEQNFIDMNRSTIFFGNELAIIRKP